MVCRCWQIDDIKIRCITHTVCEWDKWLFVNDSRCLVTVWAIVMWWQNRKNRLWDLPCYGSESIALTQWSDCLFTVTQELPRVLLPAGGCFRGGAEGIQTPPAWRILLPQTGEALTVVLNLKVYSLKHTCYCFKQPHFYIHEKNRSCCFCWERASFFDLDLQATTQRCAKTTQNRNGLATWRNHTTS